MDEFEEFLEECVELNSDIPEPCVTSSHGPTINLPSSDTYKNAQMWATSGDSFFPCESTQPSLDPGQYLVRFSESRGYFFIKKNVNLDGLIVLPDNNTEKVLDTIADFWTKEQAFRNMGFLWKRGILLWGPPGSGKTSTVQQLSQQIIDKGGISIYCTYPSGDAEGLRLLRKIEPNRPIVVILEDIDAIIEQHGEAELLAMLDGELQIDNVVFVATTNYPEKLDKRIKNRPSRFDEVIKIGMPSAECRRVYLSHKNSRLIGTEELTQWVKDTDEFSVAHLKELIVSVECLGNDVKSSIKRLRKMITSNISSGDLNNKIGF